MGRIFRLGIFGAICGIVVSAAAFAFTHGINFNSEDGIDRARHAVVFGAISGAMGAILGTLALRPKS